MVDAAHPYVEMTSGMYAGGATLSGKAATLVGAGATIVVTNNNDLLVVDGQGSLTIRHLTVLASADATSNAIECRQASELSASQLEVTGRSLAAGGCKSVKIDRSSFTNAGIGFDNGNLVDVGLFVDRTRIVGGGISATGNAFFARITNCVIVHTANQSPAVRLRQFTSGPAPSVESRIEYNTVIGGFVDCSQGDPGTRRRYFNSNVFADLDVQLPRANECVYDYNLVMPPDFALNGLMNISVDPQFVDKANGDYHLATGSPAIDAADPTSTIDHDFDGTKRPQGSIRDMGAFERAK